MLHAPIITYVNKFVIYNVNDSQALFPELDKMYVVNIIRQPF